MDTNEERERRKRGEISYSLCSSLTMKRKAAIVFFFLFFTLLHSLSPLFAAPVSSLHLSPSPPANLSLPSDALALLAFKYSADVDNKLHFSLKKRSDYCLWPGVKCVYGKVVRFVIEGFALKGKFGENTLSRLDQLRVLSLANNSLIGPIPNLSGLVNLKSLFLDHNFFTGNFPPSILSLHRIRTVDLSHNNLTGPIPAQLTTLDRLYYLRLESNAFNGSIPPLNQSSLRSFNVSNNNLTGAIPVTIVLSGFATSSFLSNPGLCGVVIHKECSSHLPFFDISTAPPPPTSLQNDQTQGILTMSPSPPRKHKKTAAVVIFCVVVFLVIGSVLGVLFAVKKRRKQRRISTPPAGAASAEAAQYAENYNESPAVESEAKVNKSMQALQVGKSGSLVFCAGESQIYTVEQLMRASAEMLGRGTVGTTYKAVLDNHLIVSVKRLDAGKMASVSKEMYDRHMMTVGGLRHPNLVPLRAFFQAKEERLLIYDYQPNGSLFSLIHGSRSTRAKPLHWTSCLKIAEDVAQGLAYIHQASRLVHGNIKSSNVLLGADFEACLTDYCLTALAEPPEDDDSGYRAPETRKTNRRGTSKSDVYAFGVLLLELLTGKTPLHHPFITSTDLPTWVRSVREEDGSGEDDRLAMILDIATACVRSSSEQRPTTWQVLKMIQEVKETEMGEYELDSTAFS